jgi:S1-C subfamily serine protease
MRGISRAMLAGLAVALALGGCAPRARDIEMGANRYLVTVNGNSYASFGTVEEAFQARAREVARAHGFDSFIVSEYSTHYTMTPLGLKPTARGVVYVYNGPKKTADGKTAHPAGSKSSGTAFAVNPDGVLLTNAHVAASCTEISVRRFDGSIYPASLLAADASNDLALIKIPQPTPEHAQLRAGAEIRQGDNVVAVGFPLPGELSGGSSTTLTTGTVSALAGVRNDSRKLQISAPIQPGNSGGPLFDQSGNVVGIVTSSMDTVAQAVKTGAIPENINFAIKTSVARTFMDGKGVTYRLTPSDKQLSNAEIGDRARKFTHFVTCTS